MTDLEYSTVVLPSRGLLYGDTMPGGEIGMRKLLAVEREKLAESSGRVFDRLCSITEKACKFPEGFKSDSLLTTDRLFILLANRAITHGPEYRVTVRCPHCGRPGTHTVNIVEDLTERTPDVVDRELAELGRDFTFGDEPIMYTLRDAGV